MIDLSGAFCAGCRGKLTPAKVKSLPNAVGRLRIVCAACYEKALALDPLKVPYEGTSERALWLLGRALRTEAGLLSDEDGWMAGNRKKWMTEHAEELPRSDDSKVEIVPIFRTYKASISVYEDDGVVVGVSLPREFDYDIEKALVVKLPSDSIRVSHITDRHVVLEIR